MNNGRLDRVELLMGMCRDQRADNDDWRRQVWREGNERAKRVLELLELIEQEHADLQREGHQLAQYLPRQAEATPMPKAVTKGPAVG